MASESPAETLSPFPYPLLKKHALADCLKLDQETRCTGRLLPTVSGEKAKRFPALRKVPALAGYVNISCFYLFLLVYMRLNYFNILCI